MNHPYLFLLLVCFLLFWLTMMSIRFFVHPVCSLDSTLYSDSSVFLPFWMNAYGQYTVDDRIYLLGQGLEELIRIFEYNDITRWWVDSGLLLSMYRMDLLRQHELGLSKEAFSYNTPNFDDPPIQAFHGAPWDTDIDIGVDFMDVPKLLNLTDNKSGQPPLLLSNEWTFINSFWSWDLDGHWVHSADAPLHFVHVRTGFRMEIWFMNCNSYQNKPPHRDYCKPHLAGRESDTLRPIELIEHLEFRKFSFKNITVDRVAVPEHPYLSTVFSQLYSKSFVQPPTLQKALCLSTSGFYLSFDPFFFVRPPHWLQMWYWTSTLNTELAEATFPSWKVMLDTVKVKAGKDSEGLNRGITPDEPNPILFAFYKRGTWADFGAQGLDPGSCLAFFSNPEGIRVGKELLAHNSPVEYLKPLLQVTATTDEEQQKQLQAILNEKPQSIIVSENNTTESSSNLSSIVIFLLVIGIIVYYHQQIPYYLNRFISFIPFLNQIGKKSDRSHYSYSRLHTDVALERGISKD